MLFVLLAVLDGSGLVLYLAMWIIVPKEPQADMSPQRLRPTVTESQL